jgi:hypothetical protein
MHPPDLRIHWSQVTTKKRHLHGGRFFEFSYATNSPYGSVVVVVVVCSFL